MIYLLCIRACLFVSRFPHSFLQMRCGPIVDSIQPFVMPGPHTGIRIAHYQRASDPGRAADRQHLRQRAGPLDSGNSWLALPAAIRTRRLRLPRLFLPVCALIGAISTIPLPHTAYVPAIVRYPFCLCASHAIARASAKSARFQWRKA